MKIDRVILDKNESEWFSKNVVRSIEVMEGAAKKDPQILERVTYKTLKAIASKDLTPKEEGSEILLSRKQKQVIANMVLQTMSVLADRIIPEYQRRNLTEYLDDAKIKLSLLKGMYRKFQ